MPGLVPGIQPLPTGVSARLDYRDKPGNDKKPSFLRLFGQYFPKSGLEAGDLGKLQAGIGRGRLFSSIATKVKVASVTMPMSSDSRARR